MSDEELLQTLGASLRSDTPAGPDEHRVNALRAAVLARGAQPQLVEPRRSGTLVRQVAAAAAVVVVFAAGVFVGTAVDRRAPRSEGPGTPDAPGMVEYAGPIVSQDRTLRAELSVVKTGIGRVVHLETDELPILPTGELYEVWFVAPGDRPGARDRISAGTFHPDDDGRSDVVFAAAVDPAKYPTVEITAEPGGGDPDVNGPVVLSVKIAP